MEPSSEFIQQIKCSAVIEALESRIGLARGKLKINTKQHGIVQARHVAVYLCRRITGRSYPQIARAVGYADHTSALYADRVAPMVLRDPEWAEHARAVEEEFKGVTNA